MDGRMNYCGKPDSFAGCILEAVPIRFMHFLQVILDAKSDEFVSIFQGATDDEKRRVMAVLNQIDPTHGDKYRKIMTSSQ